MFDNLKEKLVYHQNVTFRLLPFFYRYHKAKSNKNKDIRIVGLIRERNESLLLQDTLDHFIQLVDAIVVFDDASDDNSVAIAKNHPGVIEVIENKSWRSVNRIWEEAANRKKLHDRAKKYNPDWFFYCDADERFEGDIKNYLHNECPNEINSIRIPLFDAYITEYDKESYKKGMELYNFRNYFGPERRDILMIWRNRSGADFRRKDGREPQNIINQLEITKFYCQHYGKSLSVEHWEETCDYYINFFPKYRDKWQERKGKAIHEKSDFDRPLYIWDDVKTNSVKIN